MSRSLSGFRVLVIEGDPDRVQLLEEAFTEMQELRFAKPAYPACGREYALDAAEALAQLAAIPQQPPDAIVWNISSGGGDASSLAVFQSLRAAAQGAAIVLIASADDEQMALGLVRQGAQDYLLATEIDCAPLARAIRCSIERSRLEYARQSVSLTDDLTGLFNRRGMAKLVERDARLARTLGLEPWSLELRLEPTGSSPADPAARDLERLEMADRLSEFAARGPAAGRIDDDTFLIAGIAASQSEAATISQSIAARLRLQRSPATVR